MNKEKDSPVLYQEDTQTPTNLETTAQAPITKKDDGVILDQYQDQNKQNQYATKPNTTTETQKSSTGSGLDAALGTEYSWNTKAEERANLDYESAVLESKSNFLQSRQDLETKGLQGQEQIDMQKYSTNQSNEKAGWTGGYVLDTERQMAYLKQTIQSQMYGQMELQKYGYDTSLAAARLAYDTNKYDLALEYYNTALSRAVSEAEITGYYVSPETSEMLNEYSIASRIMNDETIPADDPEKIRADKILTSVYEWFEANGISKQGVETYSHLVEERTHKMSIDKLYEYQNTAQNQISTDTFVKLDENGNKIYGETGMETIDFSKMTTDEILKYTKQSAAAKDQYLSRLDSIAYDMENSFKTWCSGQSDLVKEDGSLDTTKDYISAFSNYIKSSEFADKIAKEIGRLLPEGSKQETINDVKALIESWSVEIELPNGEIKQLKAYAEKPTPEPINLLEDGTKEVTIIDENGEETQVDINYLKNANNITDLMEGLSNEDVKPLLDMMLNIDFSSEKAIAESISNWSESTNDIPIISTIANLVNLALSPVSVNFEVISDQAQADYYKQQANVLTNIKQSFNDILGEKNIQLITDAADHYNKLSEKDKANMMTTTTKEDGTTEKVPNTELTALQNSAKIIAQLNSIDKAINYAKNHDSGMFSEPWDYIADTWKTTAENWNDGYQFGDLTRTAFNAVENVGTTITSALVGGVKWLFSWF